jgi:RHH-type transcriptional regulator, rel operon repressor / antitoxin RelB
LLALRLDADLEARLTAVAKQTGMSKSLIAREAIQERVDYFEDLALVTAAMRDYDPAQNVSLEDVIQRLGLEG